MLFDLIKYKIRIIRSFKTKKPKFNSMLPVDVPGTILSLDTKSGHLIEQYIGKYRLIEAICSRELTNFPRSNVYVRWDNDTKGWYSINNSFKLISTNYPICMSIWSALPSRIMRDFRRDHERKPMTKVNSTFKKKSLFKKHPALEYMEIPTEEEQLGTVIKQELAADVSKNNVKWRNVSEYHTVSVDTSTFATGYNTFGTSSGDWYSLSGDGS